MLPIDHVTVAGVDLRRMQAALDASGIATVFGGAHHDGVTEMALVSFPDGSYLELVAMRPQAVSRNVEGHPPDLHPWSRFLKGNAGPCAWAVCTGDLDSEIRRLRSAGVAVAGPTANGRLRPDGVRLDWRIATCGAGPAGCFFPFLIQDVTARDLRAFPQGTPGNREYRGIARVVIAVRNLDVAVARYRQAYGMPGAIEQEDPAFGARLAVLDDAPVVFAQPLHDDSWLTARLEQFGEAPCAVLLEAAVPQHHAGIADTRWFDIQIRWFDRERLGWRLGSTECFEPQGSRCR